MSDNDNENDHDNDNKNDNENDNDDNENKEEDEERINIMALGNFAVGKTSLIIRYTECCFQPVYLFTMGIDFKIKKITLPNKKKLKIYFYDTTGQERFKSLTKNSIKIADGILLLYDITQKKSFEAISEWMKSIQEIKGDNFPIILLGNKCDLENKREITKEQGIDISNKYNISFYEISNKEGINTEEPFSDLINKILENKKNEEIILKEKSKDKSMNPKINVQRQSINQDNSSPCKC